MPIGYRDYIEAVSKPNQEYDASDRAGSCEGFRGLCPIVGQYIANGLNPGLGFRQDDKDHQPGSIHAYEFHYRDYNIVVSLVSRILLRNGLRLIGMVETASLAN